VITSSASFGPGKTVPPPTTSSDKASVGIREGLAHTRDQLADTVEALGHKMDVPSGIIDKWQVTKDTLHAKIGQVAQHLHEG
jgi:hypothetical protein